ncbi:pyroglutamyl-peptidase I [Rothia sp. ZJ1223]|uniref:pyroglutamyl-peptidase I family protein n=1 Tax=Rothia sp. ZJ1223 TaxID=2811098 RepID=UPI001957EB06|nr:pyroglutamyl-peptidase I [Rothia sp. ZJ1223]MBM7051119.1 pyroglutamyl-peptidase I [Rothia sp. ZJ1223]
MSTALITYFGAFEGVAENPTQQVAEYARAHLEQTRPHLNLVLAELPVAFDTSANELRQLIKAHKPDAVIATGVAVGRDKISLERIAINCDDARIADNAGDQRQDTPIIGGAPAAYFSTLPYRAIFSELGNTYPLEISNTAGTYVCNHVFFHLMHTLADTGIPAGFIHIPAIGNSLIPQTLTAHQDTGGVEGKTVPMLPLETVGVALSRAVELTLDPIAS